MSDLHQSARYADMRSRPPICSYCLADVVTIENGREHVLTCPSNPMVQRIAALESHVRALEQALAEAMIRGVDDLASRGRWTALLDSDPSASPPTDKDPAP